MKATHKTTPKPEDYQSIEAYAEAWENWAETQEKELQKLKNTWTVEQPYKGCPAVEQLIKEILGE